MAEQEKKELSMDEILASIRNILQDSNDEDAALSHDNEEVFELSSDMMVKESNQVFDKNLEAKKQSFFASSAYLENKEDNSSSFSKDGFVSKDNYFSNVEKKSFDMSFANKKEITENVCDNIIKDFANIFEQNKPLKQSQNMDFDAKNLLDKIVLEAIENKITNEVLEDIVKNTVVPVLSNWLKLYLPKIVEKEVERVMVKVD